jgi:putative flippase GtrA
MPPVIIIPAYNPSNRLLELVEGLVDYGFSDLIIINDGSHPSFDFIFQKLSEYKQCHILYHAVNSGKGRAIKTALNFYYLYLNNTVGVVTVDADGQHQISDIVNVANALEHNHTCLILGCRLFSGRVPLKSHIGNICTKYVFRFLTGKKLIDTQTGLRGIPRKIIPQFIKLEGERFDYEMNMLIESPLKIIEISINTIYLDNNSNSHFNPITDSFKIYRLFFRFIFSSVITSSIDYICFIILFLIGANILICIFASRIIAGFFNFYTNKKFVFDSKKSWIHLFIKYFSLVFTTGFIAYIIINYAYNNWIHNIIIVKILTELILF